MLRAGGGTGGGGEEEESDGVSVCVCVGRGGLTLDNEEGVGLVLSGVEGGDGDRGCAGVLACQGAGQGTPLQCVAGQSPIALHHLCPRVGSWVTDGQKVRVLWRQPQPLEAYGEDHTLHHTGIALQHVLLSSHTHGLHLSHTHHRLRQGWRGGEGRGGEGRGGEGRGGEEVTKCAS